VNLNNQHGFELVGLLEGSFRLELDTLPLMKSPIFREVFQACDGYIRALLTRL